jgi:hypothetical protein
MKILKYVSVTVLQLIWAAVAGLIASGGMLGTSLAASSDNSEVCRKVTEAVMRSDIEAAVKAVGPVPSDHASVQESMVRLTDGVAGLFKGKTPRLERTVPDAYLGPYPVSLQIWSFGDKDVYFVGCLFRMREEGMQLQLQLDGSADDVVFKLQRFLSSN